MKTITNNLKAAALGFYIQQDKFENIIREIKLNQKKSEYLMKKYIFDLLSRKKSVYKG